MTRERRTFLKLGGFALASLAGCVGAPRATETPPPTEEPTPTPTATPTPTPTPTPRTEYDFGGWFADTDNYDGTTVPRLDADEVTVAVGTEGNGGNFAFDPPAVRVAPGATVVWEWTGEGGAHNVVADDGTFSSGDPVAESGHTYERTFEEPMVALYFCDPHDALGMRGAVVVGDARPEG